MIPSSILLLLHTLFLDDRHGTDYDLIYEKLPKDIAERYVFLMDPILGTGNSAARCIEVSTSSCIDSAGMMDIRSVDSKREGGRRIKDFVSEFDCRASRDPQDLHRLSGH